MPGTLVRDALRPTLLNGNITGNTNGAAVEVHKPCAVRARLSIGAVSGTSPTMDVTIQVSDNGTTWSDLVRFPQKTNAHANSVAWVDTKIYRRFVRAVATVGGTSPNFGSVVLTLEAANLHRRETDVG